MVTERVTDAERYAASMLGDVPWSPLAGRDGTSRVYTAGDVVIKLRRVSPFEAENLTIALQDVHDTLAPLNLAPALRLSCYDGEKLVTVCDRVLEPVVGARPRPGEVGAALAKTHKAMAKVPARASDPWIGFYGEYHEFAMIIPAVRDDELRELGMRLLPYAFRERAVGPTHYVHRDVHPENVLIGPHGPCFIDWELVHAGAALDDLAMTACMWAAETPDVPAVETVDRVLRGYAGGPPYTLNSAPLRAALALAGLRQGIGAWFTDEGSCTAPYWPYIRRRIRAVAEVLCAEALN